MLLTKNENAHFSEFGYVTIENVFSSEEVKKLVSATETESIRSELELRRVNDRVVHLLELTTRHPYFKKLAVDSRLTDRAACLIGDDIQLQHSKLATKPGVAGEGKFPWHQDFVRYPHTNYSLLAVTIMLDDATPENGGLYALKGSHKLGPRNHVRDGWMIGPCYETHLWEDSPELIIPMMARAGGIIIHHCLLLHYSPATLSGKPRRTIAFEYRAGDSLQLANNIWTDTGYQVHGVPKHRVRCEDIEMVLPKDPAWLRYCGDAHGDAFNQIGPTARKWNAKEEESK